MTARPWVRTNHEDKSLTDRMLLPAGDPVSSIVFRPAGFLTLSNGPSPGRAIAKAGFLGSERRPSGSNTSGVIGKTGHPS